MTLDIYKILENFGYQPLHFLRNKEQTLQIIVCTDSTLKDGGGYISINQIVPTTSDHIILFFKTEIPAIINNNHKDVNSAELFTNILAIVLIVYAAKLSCLTLQVFIDNKNSVACINRQSARKEQLAILIRYLQSFVMPRRIHIKAEHIAGKANTLADDISRKKVNSNHPKFMDPALVRLFVTQIVDFVRHDKDKLNFAYSILGKFGRSTSATRSGEGGLCKFNISSGEKINESLLYQKQQLQILDKEMERGRHFWLAARFIKFRYGREFTLGNQHGAAYKSNNYIFSRWFQQLVSVAKNVRQTGQANDHTSKTVSFQSGNGAGKNDKFYGHDQTKNEQNAPIVGDLICVRSPQKQQTKNYANGSFLFKPIKNLDVQFEIFENRCSDNSEFLSRLEHIPGISSRTTNKSTNYDGFQRERFYGDPRTSVSKSFFKNGGCERTFNRSSNRAPQGTNAW